MAITYTKGADAAASVVKEVECVGGKAATPPLAGHEVKVLALHGSQEDLEGASTEGAVILEFPGIEAAKAWNNGSPYLSGTNVILFQKRLALPNVRLVVGPIAELTRSINNISVSN